MPHMEYLSLEEFEALAQKCQGKGPIAKRKRELRREFDVLDDGPKADTQRWATSGMQDPAAPLVEGTILQELMNQQISGVDATVESHGQAEATSCPSACNAMRSEGRLCLGFPSSTTTSVLKGSRPTEEPAALEPDPWLRGKQQRCSGLDQSDRQTHLEGGLPALADAPETTWELKLHTVAPNANGYVEARRAGDGRPIKVQDRARQQYPDRHMLKPVVKRNLASKRRLKDLLNLPKVPIDAASYHPSRFFNVVPAQNLRVV